MFKRCGTAAPLHIECIVDQAGRIDLGRATIAFTVLFQHGFHGIVLGLMARSTVVTHHGVHGAVNIQSTHGGMGTVFKNIFVVGSGNGSHGLKNIGHLTGQVGGKPAAVRHAGSKNPGVIYPIRCSNGINDVANKFFVFCC